MQTKQLIQTSANVIRITELTKGNVVKLIKKEYSEEEIYYGVVTDLFNSGDETFIQLLLFKNSYGDLKGTVKIYRGGEDINLFPATVEEVEESLSNSLERMSKKIEDKEKELQKEKEALIKAKEFVSGETSKKLTNTSFKELTSAEFNLEQKEKKIKAIRGE